MKKSPTHEKVRAYFQSLLDSGAFASESELARHLGLPASKATKFYNFLDGKEPSYKAVLEWLDRMGGELLLPHERPADRDVCFINARVVPAGEQAAPPLAEDYLAAPLVGEVGAGPGFIPEEDVKSWFLVYKNLPAVRYKRNLLAVEIGSRSTSMMPTLSPGDIVLVDRDDRDVSRPGHMMLVKDPAGEGMIKRVAVEDVEGGDCRITYYSDNTVSNPPSQYSLRTDFLGDWERAIVGRVIWAWSDVSEK